MKIVSKISTIIGMYSLIFVSQVLANGDESHAPGEMHNDAVAVDPMLIIIPVVLVLGGIIVWKIMFSKKKVTPSQPPQGHTEVPKPIQQSSQPGNLETKK